MFLTERFVFVIEKLPFLNGIKNTEKAAPPFWAGDTFAVYDSIRMK